MSVKLSSLKADFEREAKGDWIDYPDWPGVAFKVSSLHLPAYQTARDIAYKRLNKAYSGVTVPQTVMSAEMGKLYAKHILHDWRGLDESFSPERALEILTDPEYRNVVAAVEYCAAKVSEVAVEFVEDEAKNSARPTAGA